MADGELKVINFDKGWKWENNCFVQKNSSWKGFTFRIVVYPTVKGPNTRAICQCSCRSAGEERGGESGECNSGCHQEVQEQYYGGQYAGLVYIWLPVISLERICGWLLEDQDGPTWMDHEERHVSSEEHLEQHDDQDVKKKTLDKI